MICPSLLRSRGLAVALAVGLLAPVSSASAGQSRIELADGSVLTGELVGVEQGGYRIRSPVLGELVLPESKVVAIRPLGAAGSAGAASVPTSVGAGASPGALLDLQSRMMGDTEILSAIQSMQDDPQLQAALADPAFAQAVLSGDIEGLQQDPRFLKLMEHPTIRRIIDQMTPR